MENSFKYLRRQEYYVDKSHSLKGILDGRYNKFRFTRPRGWGKTSFQQMMREFLAMSVDKEGKEIENHSFDSFKNLKVVTEDRVNIEDVLYILRVYDKYLSGRAINEISSYYFKRNYPWFIEMKQHRPISQQHDMVDRLYARAREGFSCSEEEFQKMDKSQIKEYIENLRVNSPEDEPYFKLLSTFGETCKHYKKYPTIFVEFPEVFELELSPTSQINESLETEIKNSIAKAFKTHDYQLDFLKAQILKKGYQEDIDELKEFEQYLGQQANPSNSLKLLSRSLCYRYKIPTVLIVDEYDTPISNAKMIDEIRYNQIRGSIAQILASIKDEKSIHYASLTGISRSSYTNFFSGHNDLAELSILDLEFSECFGFAASEVVELIKKYNQKNPQKQLDYEELKRWYSNNQIDGSIFFNPYSVVSCLEHNGFFQPYWTDSGSFTMILEQFKKIEAGKEEIAECLLKGEVEFYPLGNCSWEDLKQPTFQAFFSFLLHTGYLSLATGETVDIFSYQKLKFVIPNLEIRNLIDTKLLVPFYEMILEFKCTLEGRSTIVKSAGNNEFMKNLNDSFLKNISYSENHPITKTHFESMIFGIFFIERAEIYQAEAQKTLNIRRINSVFYPGSSSEQRIAILHEYKVCQIADNKEEKAFDAIWQCLTRNYLKCVSDGKMIIEDKESNWSEVKLRGIVFYPNMHTFRWCASSVEYTVSLKEVKDILKIFSCFENKQNESRKQLLSGKLGKYGTREEIENERALFLKEHNAESLSAFFKSAPFRYQQTPFEPKIKAGFSSVKLGFSPLPAVNFTFFDSSKCYPLSAVSSWRLQSSNHSSFALTKQRSSLLKASSMMRPLKLLSKIL